MLRLQITYFRVDTRYIRAHTYIVLYNTCMCKVYRVLDNIQTISENYFHMSNIYKTIIKISKISNLLLQTIHNVIHFKLKKNLYHETIILLKQLLTIIILLLAQNLYSNIIFTTKLDSIILYYLYIM